MPSRTFLRTSALAALCALAACNAPADETWLRVASVMTNAGEVEDGEDATTGTSVSATVLDVDLQNGTTDKVDLVLENSTVIVGNASGGGVPIHVYHATVEYEFSPYNLPDYAYAVSLLVPAPTGGEAGLGIQTATLVGLPVAPATLKSWMLVPDNLPPEVTAGSFNVLVKITLRARTEEGRELETSASLTLVFS
jgi:hypothetical protein